MGSRKTWRKRRNGIDGLNNLAKPNITGAGNHYRLFGECLIGELIQSDNKEYLLQDLTTQDNGPLAIIDLEIKIKFSNEVSLAAEMSAQKILVDSFVLWNVPDEDVFKNNVDKKFLGTLSMGKKSGIDFFLPLPLFSNFTYFFFLLGLLQRGPWLVSAWRLFLLR